MSQENQESEESSKEKTKRGERKFMKTLVGKLQQSTCAEDLDDETIEMAERLVVLRISTKHINLWIRQLEMKRNEMSQLAALMELDEIKKEREREKSLERRARRCTNYFTEVKHL